MRGGSGPHGPFPPAAGNKRLVARCCDLSIDSPDTGRPLRRFRAKFSKTITNRNAGECWFSFVFLSFPPDVRRSWQMHRQGGCDAADATSSHHAGHHHQPYITYRTYYSRYIPQTINDYCTINPGAVIDRRPDLFPVNTNVTRSDDEETRLCGRTVGSSGFCKSAYAYCFRHNVAVTARDGRKRSVVSMVKTVAMSFYKRLYTSLKSGITVRWLGLVSFDRWNKPPRPPPVTRSCTYTHKRFKQLAPTLASGCPKKKN